MAAGTNHFGGGLLLLRGTGGVIFCFFCESLALLTDLKALVGSSKACSMVLSSIGSTSLRAASVVASFFAEVVVEGVFSINESSGAKVAIFSSSPDSTKAINSVFT